MNEIQIASKNIKRTEYGLEISGSITPSEWLDAAQYLRTIGDKVQFYLGDLAVYAESPVTGWGESKYNDLIEATGYEYETIKQFARVARRYPLEMRERVYSSTPISWKCFQEVAPLDDEHAMYFLEKAGKSKWTVAKLREEIVRWKNNGSLPDKKERATEELPDGFVSFKEANPDVQGYIPVPLVVGDTKKVVHLPVDMTDWEAELVLDCIRDNPRLLMLADRIERTFGG